MAFALKRFLAFILFCPAGFCIAAQTVTLTTLDWPPYIGKSVNSAGDKGYVYDIVVAALKQSGYQAKIEFLPWARAVKKAEDGAADAVFPEYFSAVNEIGTFSDKFPGGPVGLLSMKSSAISFNGLNDLLGKKIGIVRGYTNTEEFDNNNQLTKLVANDDITNLKKLVSKRLDLTFIDKYVAWDLLKQDAGLNKYTSADFTFKTLEDKDLYVNFSHKAPDSAKKLAAFNAGLAAINADGSLQKFLQHYGF